MLFQGSQSNGLISTTRDVSQFNFGWRGFRGTDRRQWPNLVLTKLAGTTPKVSENGDGDKRFSGGAGAPFLTIEARPLIAEDDSVIGQVPTAILQRSSVGIYFAAKSV